MATDIVTAGTANAIAWLADRGKRIRIFPERDFRALRAECIVMDTPPVQRLRRVRQLGLANLVFPTAEHSRFAHSLGAAYWTSKFLDALRKNHFAKENGIAMSEAASLLGDQLNLDLVARLYALLHDISHIPFGHTLEDQFGFFPRHDEDPDRLNHCFDNISKALADHPDLAGAPDGTTEALQHHLNCVRDVMELDRVLHGEKDIHFRLPQDAIERALPALTFIHDMVSNTLCADLVDYSLRDSLGASMPRSFDKIILEYIAILPMDTATIPRLRDHFAGSLAPVIMRFGTNPIRKKLRHDVVTAIVALLRARYELAERVYYHHAKCAADAMLDRLVRPVRVGLGTTTQLVDMGDDEFLARMRTAIAELNDPNLSRLQGDFDARHLYKEIYRISDRSLTKEAHDRVTRAATPDGREAVEAEILAQLPNLNSADLIVSSRPLKMQMKEAGALVAWHDGKTRTLAEVAERFAYAREVQELTRHYADLWSCSVYINPRKIQTARRVIQVCSEIFGMTNSDALARSLHLDARIPWELHREIDSVRDDVTDEALGILAARGSVDVANLYQQRVSPTTKVKARKGRHDGESTRQTGLPLAEAEVKPAK